MVKEKGAVLSDLGEEMNQLSGVRAIMKDIEHVQRAGKKRKLYDFGAGNPAVIPAVLREIRKTTKAIANSNSAELGEVVSRYGSTRGYAPFIDEFIRHVRRQMGWKITAENVLVTPGSQAFNYYAVNAFAGKFTGKGKRGRKGAGAQKKVLFPLMPEYTGYMHMGVGDKALRGVKPHIEVTAGHEFKYKVNFKHLDLKDIGLVVFSRPCNPSGNVLHDSEVKEIVKQAGKKNIPVIVDSAYASPVPNVCYTPMKYVRGKNVITTFSFSKAGLAAARLGVAVGDKKYIDAVKAFQANVCIFPPVFGQEVARRMLHNGKLARLCEKEVKPFYKKKLEIFRKACAEFIDDAVPYFIHKSEGTFFAWIWFKDLPVNDWKLFELLKSQGVIVVPGSPFFPGAGKGWMHAQECIRLSVTGTEKDIRAGVKGLAGVVNKLYKK